MSTSVVASELVGGLARARQRGPLRGEPIEPLTERPHLVEQRGEVRVRRRGLQRAPCRPRRLLAADAVHRREPDRDAERGADDHGERALELHGERRAARDPRRV
ncbi:MAG: hypothetical protein H6828_07080 [Planctomycetes bacterium]|nr:hypothetical protein [Planctomycetota bacterium]